jgi:hypothetical protein
VSQTTTKGTQEALDASRLFLDVMRYFLEHPRVALVLDSINSPTSILPLFVKSLEVRLSAALSVVKSQATPVSSNQEREALLVLSVLLRAATRLGKWLHRYVETSHARIRR